MLSRQYREQLSEAFRAVDAGTIGETRERLDATDPQPATSEMLAGFVLGCVCSAVVLWVWNWKL